MGLSVSEYFAQKEACASCVEHGTEEHCVTTLLSRKENCFVYSIINNQLGDYTQEEIELLRKMREESTEEENVIYYIRGENIIEKMKLMEKPFYEQVHTFSYINYKYIKNVVEALVQKRTEDAKRLINNMLEVLEKENNIPKELNEFKYY